MIRNSMAFVQKYEYIYINQLSITLNIQAVIPAGCLKQNRNLRENLILQLSFF